MVTKEQRIAAKVLLTKLSDPCFECSGRRNDDTFDTYVALKVLGLEKEFIEPFVTEAAMCNFLYESGRMDEYMENYMAIGADYALSKLIGQYEI